MSSLKGVFLIKKTKMIAYIMFIVMMTVSCIMPIQAQDDNEEVNIEAVFPSEEVNKLSEEANNAKIYVDSKNKARSAFGKYPRRKGVILVTDDEYKGIGIGHSAIIYNYDNVIEANITGVEKGKNNWYSSKNQAYGVTVKSTNAVQDGKVADWCYKQLGKPYNLNFYRMDFRNSFYCSHLIRAGFLDVLGIDLNTGEFDCITLRAIHPMELVHTSKTMLVYRRK